LHLVEASPFARRPIGSLSGGQRQKLLLAQALLGSPRLLLLDEPLLSLDPRQQATVVALVRGVQRALGIAVLFSAHDVNSLLPAMDQVLYLGGGHGVLGPVGDVVTGPVLSLLYGAPIEVVRLGARYLVVAGETVPHKMGAG
jgi:zinc/manganese transport system ATP-binding protein